MKYGVIDIGSNSVRLMLSDGVNTLNKCVKTTRLAEGMGLEKIIKPEPMERTAQAVSTFYDYALKQKAGKIYVFATAAVRQAINGLEFVERVKSMCGIDVDVVLGDMEARIGLVGALNGKDGGIIDVGGASSEVTVSNCNKEIYGKSITIGAVAIKDVCGQDLELAKEMILNKIQEFGNIPFAEFYAIGGTATSLAAIVQELEPYDPKKTDGFVLDIDVLKALTEKLYKLPVKERKKLKGLQPERAEVIAGGAYLLYAIANKIGLDKIIVSEKDNLEGYLMLKMEKI